MPHFNREQIAVRAVVEPVKGQRAVASHEDNGGRVSDDETHLEAHPAGLAGTRWTDAVTPGRGHFALVWADTGETRTERHERKACFGTDNGRKPAGRNERKPGFFRAYWTRWSSLNGWNFGFWHWVCWCRIGGLSGA
jgi:hypothetical protein